MRAWMPLLLVIGTSLGCTSTQLRHNTAGQVGTLTELQHQIVLNNLAAFSCNPDTIPFHANMTYGATQVADTGSAAIEYLNRLSVALGLSRSVVDQWSMTPVTDEITLRLLRIAYRRSLGFPEDLYTEDLANRVAHRLKGQIAVGPDVGVQNAILFSRGPSLPNLLDRPGWRGEPQLGFRDNDETVIRWQKDTLDIISSNSDRIVLVGERVTRETLGVTPLLYNGMPYVPQGERVPRVLVATPYAAELRRQVLALNDYLLEINPGWLVRGQNKKEVPKCACYVGHHKECGCQCYVWVAPEGRQAFEDFTLRTLRLISLVRQETDVVASQGIMFSPISTR